MARTMASAREKRSIEFRFEVPLEHLSEYGRGYIDGLIAYAHWKDGIEYVGTCGTPLRAAAEGFLKQRGESGGRRTQ